MRRTSDIGIDLDAHLRGWVEGMARDPRIEGGPGWYIDEETLLPTIEDEALFRAAHAHDPALEIVIAIWTGRPKAAELLLDLLREEAATPRLRALRADAWRDQGRTDEAVAAYESLIAELTGTASEAVMQQHLGKALFVAGRYREAASAFEKALALRLRSRAEESLIASSRAAVERAREADDARDLSASDHDALPTFRMVEAPSTAEGD
jgi:tetratricopeptide (TPR) repeat protein